MYSINKPIEIFLLALALSVFLALSTRNLRYDNANSDEVVCGSQALSLIDNNINTERSASVWMKIGAKRLPVNNITDYCFALPAFMLLPVFRVLGTSVWSLKMLPILLALISLPMLYFVLKKIFGQPAALITVFLSVISPLYIHYNRSGLFNKETLIASLFIVSMFFYTLYKKNNNNIYLVIVSLLLGSLASIKVAAGAYYAGLASCAMAKPWKMFDKKQLAAILLFFTIGSSFFIYFNAATGGSSFESITRYISGKEALLPAVTTRIQHFGTLIKEKEPVMERETFSVQSSRVSMLLFLLFWGALACNWLYYLFMAPHTPERENFFFANILYGSVFICSCFSPASFVPNHLIIMFPFPQLITALFIKNCYTAGKDLRSPAISSILKYSAVAVLFAVVALKSILVNKYQSFYVSQRNGYSTVDARNENLVRYIGEHHLVPVRFIDTDTDELAFFISKGGMPVYKRTLPATPSREEVELWMRECSKDKYPQYFVYTYKLSVYDYSDNDQKMLWIKEYLRKSGKQLQLLNTLSDEHGHALYAVYVTRN